MTEEKEASARLPLSDLIRMIAREIAREVMSEASRLQMEALEKIDARIVSIETRVDRLERLLIWAAGLAIGASGIGGFVGAFVSQLI